VVPAAGAVRLFRLDRVDDVAVLDEPAAAPPDAEPTDLSAGVFPARPEHGSAVLLLEPWARWVAEYYPVEQVVELPAEPGDGATGHDHGTRGDGRARVLLRYADPAWLVRLVLGLGGGAQILEPAELAAEVARRARRVGRAEGNGLDGERNGGGAMTGVVGALWRSPSWWRWCSCWRSRPHVRRLARSVAVLRTDTATRL
jgi:predicted DNA-binding transcriptional regulator YafY